MTTTFWASAGMHLTPRNAEGWLEVTPALIGAYLMRPEIQPIEESCAAERALHAALTADPLMPVAPAQLAAFADEAAVSNYQMVLAFRDLLVEAGTVEAAYLRFFSRSEPAPTLPPVFIDQLVHLIMRNILDGVTDPMRPRASELFFREQNVSTDDGRLMFADKEVVDMHARARQETGQTGLGQLLAETGTPLRTLELDVLDDDNKAMYWARSDRFDTVIDFRFEYPALDAFARVIEAWLRHLLRVETNVQPVVNIQDPDWRWHVGLDRVATQLLNTLYNGGTLNAAEQEQVVGLFRLRFREDAHMLEEVRGFPVYLGLAMDEAKVVRMKPQNLLKNLPITATS